MGGTETIERGAIAEAYLELAGGDGEFVSIRRMRELTAGRVADLDAALIGMYCGGEINLIPQSAQQSLSEADRAAAVRCGGESKHLMSWED